MPDAARSEPPSTAMRPLTMQELPEDERPREKYEKYGATALTHAQLLALLLVTGLKGINVVEVARLLLEKYKTLTALSRCTEKEFMGIPGIGPTKAKQLVMVFELGKRLARETLSQQKLDSPEVIYEVIGHEMRALKAV